MFYKWLLDEIADKNQREPMGTLITYLLHLS